MHICTDYIFVISIIDVYIFVTWTLWGWSSGSAENLVCFPLISLRKITLLDFNANVRFLRATLRLLETMTWKAVTQFRGERLMNSFVMDSVVWLASRVARWKIFKPKISIWVNSGGSWNGICWYSLWRFVLFYCHFVYFVVIWYILWSFGIFCGHLVHFVFFVHFHPFW
jgi:hypothetical protein